MNSTIIPKQWFEEWRKPSEFLRKADDCMEQLPSDEILSMTGVQYLFDAFVIGMFGTIWSDYQPCHVRLVEDTFPDAELRSDEGVMPIENTMADRKDRRMALEHQQWREEREAGELASRPIDPEKDHQYAVEAIPRVCRRKVEKYLGSELSTLQVPAHLLIYVNFPTIRGHPLTDQEMSELTEPWRHNFKSIWLLSGARIFQPWPSPIVRTAKTDPMK